MDQLTPTLAALLEVFRPCFRTEVFATFRLLTAAWLLCPGRRTLSEVWQATGLAGQRHHDTAYATFASAKWDWDELGKLLLALLLTRLVPGGFVWLVVDDTLSHKRGAKVAFAGVFLDPVTSSKKHKNFRYGLNWVVLGLAVQLPFRPDRTVCLPLLWRVYRKKGLDGHRTRAALAADLVRLVAAWLPQREIWLVADQAYVNTTLLRQRPANVKIIGPLRGNAALYGAPPPRTAGQRGAPRVRGDRLPTPRQLQADPVAHPPTSLVVPLPSGPKTVQVQVVRGVQWYAGCGAELVSVVLVHDPSGAWKDTALLVTDVRVTAAFVIAGYARRWSIEVAFHDAKQYLGLHDPRVRCAASVTRAHPLAWFTLSVTVLWYATGEGQAERVVRPRPWYTTKPDHTFTDMLGALRLELWRHRLSAGMGGAVEAPDPLEMLLHWVAAVR